MVMAFRFHKAGGPDVMQWEEVTLGEPGKGEIRVRHTAVGLNYIDTYHRSGLYPVALPSGIGMEGCGIVEAVGADVGHVKVGDRIAYAAPPIGSYAQARIMPAEKVVVVPDGITDQQAAAMMLKGMTAQYLLRRTYPVKKGDTIVIHAAAGGVGLIVCQWAKHLGCTVIGTVGDEAKAELARKFGCDHPILYTKEDLPKRVREITGGAGVPVVYDSVGKSTYTQSLDCLAPLGMMVSFGNASGPIGPVDMAQLSARGSLFITRPTLMTYTAKRNDLVNTANELFDVVKKGIVKIEINQTYALKDAVQAHRDLESRKTTGSTVFIP